MYHWVLYLLHFQISELSIIVKTFYSNPEELGLLGLNEHARCQKKKSIKTNLREAICSRSFWWRGECSVIPHWYSVQISIANTTANATKKARQDLTRVLHNQCVCKGIKRTSSFVYTICQWPWESPLEVASEDLTNAIVLTSLLHPSSCLE